MKTIAFFNHKGGAGKTTPVYRIAWMLSESGHEVPVADLDPRADLSGIFLEEERLEELWPNPHARLRLNWKMHEMSLAEGALRIIEDQREREDFSVVRAVVLEIGELSHVEPEALRFCYDAVMKGSVAEGARLEIRRVPGEGFCLECGKNVPMKALYDPCPDCESYGLQVKKGDEMRVVELEVD